jgi:hypothetical protein
MRRFILAVMISTAGILPAAARDQFTGDLTAKQIMAIKVATIARFAGTHDNCPGVQFNENASFKVMIDAGVRPEMLGSTEFSNVVAEAILGAGEKLQENRSDWCAATWELFGPGTHLRWQMLEKVNSR